MSATEPAVPAPLYTASTAAGLRFDSHDLEEAQGQAMAWQAEGEDVCVNQYRGKNAIGVEHWELDDLYKPSPAGFGRYLARQRVHASGPQAPGAELLPDGPSPADYDALHVIRDPNSTQSDAWLEDERAFEAAFKAEMAKLKGA